MNTELFVYEIRYSVVVNFRIDLQDKFNVKLNDDQLVREDRQW